MPKGKQDPHRSYDIDDWRWEFLRRNDRYKRWSRALNWFQARFAFRAVKILWPVKTPTMKHPHYVHKKIYYADLCHELTKQCGLRSLIPPHIPAHELKESPFESSGPVDVLDSKAFELELDEDGNLASAPLELDEHELLVKIDTLYTSQEIVSKIKDILRDRRSKQRTQLRKYKDYLAVWDLRQKEWADSRIARKLWPKELNRVGGRYEDVKGPIIQRVYDDVKAAQKLIDESFPPKKRPPKIKK